MTSVTDDYTFKNVCLTFYILQAGPAKHCGAWGSLPPTLHLDRPGCINNTLINALRKLTQWVNALKKLTLQQL